MPACAPVERWFEDATTLEVAPLLPPLLAGACDADACDGLDPAEDDAEDCAVCDDGLDVTPCVAFAKSTAFALT